MRRELFDEARDEVEAQAREALRRAPKALRGSAVERERFVAHARRIRGGARETLRAKLTRRDEDALEREDGTPGKKDEGVLNGVGVGDLTPETRTRLQIPARIKGALITNIDPESPAARQGLREGHSYVD